MSTAIERLRALQARLKALDSGSGEAKDFAKWLALYEAAEGFMDHNYGDEAEFDMLRYHLKRALTALEKDTPCTPQRRSRI